MTLCLRWSKLVYMSEKEKNVVAVSVNEAAEILGTSADTVRRLVAKGELPSYRVGSSRIVRVLRSDVLALLKPVSAGFK